jgi:hypothetical protein
VRSVTCCWRTPSPTSTPAPGAPTACCGCGRPWRSSKGSSSTKSWCGRSCASSACGACPGREKGRTPDLGIAVTYDSEEGLSLFHNPRTGEIRQDIAGAKPPGVEWQQLHNVFATPPVVKSRSRSHDLTWREALAADSSLLLDVTARVSYRQYSCHARESTRGRPPQFSMSQNRIRTPPVAKLKMLLNNASASTVVTDELAVS